MTTKLSNTHVITQSGIYHSEKLDTLVAVRLLLASLFGNHRTVWTYSVDYGEHYFRTPSGALDGQTIYTSEETRLQELFEELILVSPGYPDRPGEVLQLPRWSYGPTYDQRVEGWWGGKFKLEGQS